MKILASDLDGTLIIEGKNIDQRDLDSIREMRKLGHKFVISTGRTLSGFTKTLEQFNLEFDYLVLCNGGVVLDGDMNIISNDTINHNTGLEIIEEYYDSDKLGIYYDNGEVTSLVDAPTKNYEQIGFLSDLGSRKVAKDIIKNEAKNFQMMSVFSLDKCYDRAEETKNILNDKYGEIFDAVRNQFFVDIVPKGCSKGNGLLKLSEILEVHVDDIFTVGDSYNDVSMFEITKNSYTFNRAEDGIREIAKNKIDYVHEVVKELLK
ncbi:MAG: HAD-IIB family hydrolase [Clostridium sp.]